MRSVPSVTNRAPRHGKLPIEAAAPAEPTTLSKNQEARLHRREAEIKAGQAALASALTRSLVLLRYKGNCKCGLMLTEQDKNPNAETYRCPHCGTSAPLTSRAAATA